MKDPDEFVTPAGASMWAAAYLGAVRCDMSTVPLECLAHNLGLTEIGVEHLIVSYRPLEHEDTVGGMLPGDEATILRPGWKHKDTVLIRAKVKPSSK